MPASPECAATVCTCCWCAQAPSVKPSLQAGCSYKLQVRALQNHATTPGLRLHPNGRPNLVLDARQDLGQQDRAGEHRVACGRPHAAQRLCVRVPACAASCHGAHAAAAALMRMCLAAAWRAPGMRGHALQYLLQRGRVLLELGLVLVVEARHDRGANHGCVVGGAVGAVCRQSKVGARTRARARMGPRLHQWGCAAHPSTHAGPWQQQGQCGGQQVLAGHGPDCHSSTDQTITVSLCTARNRPATSPIVACGPGFGCAEATQGHTESVSTKPTPIPFITKQEPCTGSRTTNGRPGRPAASRPQ